jgi:DNA-binding transcriptional regulator YiaG
MCNANQSDHFLVADETRREIDLYILSETTEKHDVSPSDQSHVYPDGVVAIENKKYASPEAVARMLNTSTRTLLRWESLRVGPPRIKIGHVRLYDLSRLSDWLKQHERQPLETKGAKR